MMIQIDENYRCSKRYVWWTCSRYQDNATWQRQFLAPSKGVYLKKYFLQPPLQENTYTFTYNYKVFLTNPPCKKINIFWWESLLAAVLVWKLSDASSFNTYILVINDDYDFDIYWSSNLVMMIMILMQQLHNNSIHCWQCWLQWC